GRETMPDVLSQNEIDTLLSAVDAENLDLAAPAEAPAAAAGGNFTIYDFKRPERVSTDQIHSMEMMHEVLARKLGASLSSYLRTIVEVKLASVEQLTYQEFIMSLPNPTCFNLLSCEPLDGSMVLEINPLIVFPILDKLLGGGNTDVYIPEREMSNIEWRLMSRIINDTLAFLRESWRPILDINFKVIQTEANPQLMQIVPPNEVVILICFEIKTGESSGMLNLCVPFPVIEPIMGRFSTIQTWFTTKKSHSEEEEKKNLYSGLGRATLGVAVHLASARLTVSQFLALKPGDIIRTEKDVRSPLVMTVADRPKFLGYAGKYRNHKAFRILRAIGPEEEIAF
ncbi:MAG: flagellar motor switch protein FliM, partial [Planctomycetota bacterium]|nr:flagellar motor switch protein FliM [Planctomycetota bacterium]